jgi:pre-60S factor REI1
MSEGDIDERLAASRRRRHHTDCLFCTSKAASISDILSHMSRQHSFFIPDQDHLVDIGGLLSYLGEKVTIGNLCLYCPNGGKEFASLEAVRRHMVDKAHCKIAYDDDEDQAELADFYDYGQGDALGSDWEDVDMVSGEEDEGAPAVSIAPFVDLMTHFPARFSCGRRTLTGSAFRQNRGTSLAQSLLFAATARFWLEL